MGVRKQLLIFLPAVFSNVHENAIRPFFATVMIYTCSAMTHIHEDVRVDALKFLAFWLESFQRLTVAFGAEKLLPNIINLLGRNGSGGSVSIEGVRMVSAIASNPNSQFGMSKTRMDLLETLLRLMTASAGVDAQSALWFLPTDGEALDTAKEYTWENAMDGVVLPLVNAVPSDRLAVDLFASTRQQTALVSKDFRMAYSVKQSTDVIHLIDVLQPLLMDIWMEGAPQVFVPSGSASSSTLTAIHLALKTLTFLWRTLLITHNGQNVDASWIGDHIKTIQRYIFVRFPFGQDVFALNDFKVI
jgi:hypothetical protein